jgi:[acyl-carrier-protein] S-malonyltransferase
MVKYGLVFPGQGSQKVGMGADLYESNSTVKEIFNQANQVLQRDLKEICFNGPSESLMLTTNTQPAIYLLSIAIYNVLAEYNIKPTLVAGHSLGELSAYCASGVYSFKDGLEIIEARATAMASSYPAEDSAMAAVIKLDKDKIEQGIEEFANAPVVIANYNCPGQIVISGKKESVAKASDNLKKIGGRVIPLKVSGAFHSPLMEKGSNLLAQYIENISFSQANIPILLNRTAEKEVDADNLKDNLPKQIISPVRWIEIINKMVAEVDIIIECGPGSTLTGLIKKIAPDQEVINISDKETLERFINR